MILAWVTIFIFSGAFASAADAAPCDRGYGAIGISRVEIHQRLNEINSKLTYALEQIRILETDLISGKKIPQWVDLEQLDTILRALKNGKASARENGNLGKLEGLLPDLIEFAKTDKPLQRVSASGDLKGFKPESYQPTEYELKRLYQAKLWEINRELPPPLKIRGTRIPFDQRRNSLVEEARAIVKAQEEKYPRLYPTTGFRDREALIEAIKKQSPEAKAIWEMIENEEVEFVMRRPEAGRWWIPKVGFQNQRVTGSSRGLLSTELRDSAEAFLTFGKKSEYEKLDNDLKPKYGFLRPKPGQILSPYRTAAGPYGDDLYVLNKERVRDRTTWTAGDSLYRGSNRPETDTPKSWHHAFTPWSIREPMVPVVVPKDIAKDKTFRVQRPIFDARSPLGKFSKDVLNEAYFEMQYWGPLTLDDLETFEFSKTPPAGEFLDELLKRNIKIRDARGHEPVDWHPPGRAEK